MMAVDVIAVLLPPQALPFTALRCSAGSVFRQPTTFSRRQIGKTPCAALGSTPAIFLKLSRYVHTIRTDQDGRVGRLHIAKRGMVVALLGAAGKLLLKSSNRLLPIRSHIPRPRRVDAALKPPQQTHPTACLWCMDLLKDDMHVVCRHGGIK